MLGTRWSPESHAVRDFLSRNQRPYQWVDIEIDAEAARWVDEVSPDQRRLPVVAFPDGPPLLAPSLPELGERIGLQMHATLPHYDVVIAGAGPSGLAAAVYASSEGLRTLVVESDAPGGQAGTSSMIENYPGFPSGIGGAELARRASFQAQRFGTELVSPQDVVALRVEGPTKIVTLASGSEVSSRALVVATGMKVRQLDVPGLDAWTGVGVYYGAAVSEAASCAGQDVVVVGGANSAGQAAMLLSRYARTVTMVVRGPSLSATMSRYLVDRIEASATIEVLLRSRVAAARGDRILEALTVRDEASGTEREIETHHLFIFIGSMPHSDFLAGVVARDERGFVLTGPDLRSEGRLPADWPLERDPFLLETSVPGIFAVGDVRHGSTKRVASAVGEGSAAIGSVHKYLETA